MDRHVLRVLTIGMDTTTFHAVLGDLLKHAVIDGVLTQADADIFADDIGSSRGAAASEIADYYIDGGLGRPDRQLRDLWLYIAAMSGHATSASLVATRVRELMIEAPMSALNRDELHEGAAAITWWHKLAASGEVPAIERKRRLKKLAADARRKIRAMNAADDPWGLGATNEPEAKPVPVGVGGMPLDAWRTMLPREISERIAEYRALAARLTAFDDEGHRAILTRAVAGSVRDALAVADILSNDGDLFDDGQDPDSDLRWAWTAIAALGVIRGGVGYADRDVARQSIAGRLLEHASEMKLLSENRRDAVRAMRLAAAWAADIKRVHGLNLVDRDDHYIKLANVGLAAVRSVTEAGRKVEATKAEAAAKAEVAVGAAAMVVVKSIDPGRGTGDDKSLVKAWECLTKPVQLATGPEPSVLESVLMAEFPWMNEAISAICGDLRLRRDAGRPWAYWRPVLLVGPAGSGKTRFARRVAELMGTGFGEVCVAGSSDNRMLAGTARGWSSATPSYVLQVIRREAVANPVMFIDEIDKAVADGRNGDVRNTLLAMLEPLSAKSWTDECLVGQCDLSGVNWILACNDVSKVRGPLLTRLRVIEAPAPSSDHFGVVLAGIRRDLASELGVDVDSLPELMPEAEAKLLAGFRRGISLRRVRSAVEGAIKVSGGVASAVRH